MELQNEFIIVFGIIGVALLIFLAYFYYFNTNKLLGYDKFTSKTMLIGILIIAFIIRIAFAISLPGYVSDLNCFKAWSTYSYNGGLENFYSGEFFADYPPLYIYVLYFLGSLQSAFQISDPIFGVIVRMPSIILDIVCAIFVYSIASKKFKNYIPLFLSMLIALNPAIMLNSAVWAQVDIVLTIVLIFTIYMLMKDKILFAAILYIMAILIKPQALLVGPVILFFVIKYIIDSKEKLKATLTVLLSIGVMVALFFLLPLPFGINKEPLWLVDRYMQTTSQFSYASLNSFNLFSMLGQNYKDLTDTILGMPINVFGFIMIGLVCLYTLWLFIKNSSKKMLFLLCAFVLMGIFALSHGMHERYLYPVPIFLILAYVFIKDKRLILCTILASLVLFVNESVALYYYAKFIPTQFIATLSAISMGAFIYIGYVITNIALKPPMVLDETAYIAIKIKTKEDKSNEVQMRLDSFSTQKYITKKDILIMCLIAGVYSIFAFTNLGSFNVPKNGATLNKQVEIAFNEPVSVNDMKYYAGFGEGNFEVEYSLDGTNYTKVATETENQVEHKKHQLYQWKNIPVYAQAQYFRIIPITNQLNLLELAFFDEQNQLITPTTNSLAPLFDEQSIVPLEKTYMTDFYFDEIYHVRTAYENINGIEPYEISHPPLGKLLLASGILMFGMNGFGWRFMGTLAGVLMLFVIYIIAKLFFKKTKYAAFASILLAADFMHFTQTRIGTIDSYSILFILLMFLFMYMYSKTNFNTQKFSKTIPPLFLCGLFFGIGAATKWLCIYSGVGLLAIYIFLMYRRHKEYVFAKTNDKYSEIVKNYKSNLIKTLALSVVFFLAVPAAIYLLSYIPYTQVTQGNAYGFNEILNNQKYMLNYHALLDPEVVHPFASKWYTWPMTIRPILYYSETYTNGTISNITSMGNPLIWWTGLIAIFGVAIASIKKKSENIGLLIIFIALLNQFLPWAFITRELFIYHYFATVPFLILVLVYGLKFLEKYKFGKLFGIIFVCACVAFFFFFYPVISGVRADASYISALRWLESWPFY